MATTGGGVANKSALSETDRGGAAIAEAESCGCGLAEIDNALAVERAAIVDRDLDMLTCVLVGHGDLGAEGQRAMGCRHGVFVEDLSGGGSLAIKARSIPGSTATLGIGYSGKGE